MAFFMLNVYMFVLFTISVASSPAQRKESNTLSQAFINSPMNCFCCWLGFKEENFLRKNFLSAKRSCTELVYHFRVVLGSCSFCISSGCKSIWTLLHLTQILELLLAFCSEPEMRHSLRRALLEPAALTVSANTRLGTRSKSFEPSVVALVHLSNQPLEGSEDCSGLALQLFKEIFEVPRLIAEFKELLSSSYF